MAKRNFDCEYQLIYGETPMTCAPLAIIPKETYLPLLVFAGLLMIIGLRRIAVGLFVTVLALAFSRPFIDAMLQSLPPWAFALVMLAFMIGLFRLFFGRRVADTVLGHLLYDLILAPFRFMRWLVGGRRPGQRP